MTLSCGWGCRVCGWPHARGARANRAFQAPLSSMADVLVTRPRGVRLQVDLVNGGLEMAVVPARLSTACSYVCATVGRSVIYARPSGDSCVGRALICARHTPSCQGAVVSVSDRGLKTRARPRTVTGCEKWPLIILTVGPFCRSNDATGCVLTRDPSAGGTRAPRRALNGRAWMSWHETAQPRPSSVAIHADTAVLREPRQPGRTRDVSISEASLARRG